MRILHTSDWHLGITLEGRSRAGEQEDFIRQLGAVCREKAIDVVVVAGDIYDAFNPPAEAERLFHNSLRLLCGDGRLVLVIGGNHDSPDRLMASAPLAENMGALIFAGPKTRIPSGQYGQFYIKSHGDGVVETEVNGEVLVFAAMAFASERRLNEIISPNLEEGELQRGYSRRIGELFAQRAAFFREDAVNLAAGHFHIAGGEASGGSERDIMLGGSYAVNPRDLPEKAQYIAMGHLHRAQGLKYPGGTAYYSGSPIQYSLSEANQAKSVMLADVSPGREAVTEKIYLDAVKPVELWKFPSIEEALEQMRATPQPAGWVYLKIAGERPLYPDENREMRSLWNNIVDMDFDLRTPGDGELNIYEYEEKSWPEEFRDYYLNEKGVYPSEEILKLFLEVSLMDEGEEGGYEA